jgi:O-6-methylguanine DNA methyltransferase
LQTIPFGQTCSYLDIANRLNNPGAIRAIGRANGANPIAVIIPCHRVIGSDGSLTGYAGGLWRKRWLLDHEARTAGTVLF